VVDNLDKDDPHARAREIEETLRKADAGKKADEEAEARRKAAVEKLDKLLSAIETLGERMDAIERKQAEDPERKRGEYAEGDETRPRRGLSALRDGGNDDDTDAGDDWDELPKEERERHQPPSCSAPETAPRVERNRDAGERGDAQRVVVGPTGRAVQESERERLRHHVR
jgi:hypothetical protein